MLLLTQTAYAATISISSVDAVDDPNYDLTNVYGIGDWRYWSSTANPAPGTPTNEKLGADLIGDMSPVGGGALRGTAGGGPPVYDLIFSDGTSPTNGASANQAGLFNTQLNTVGAGVQVDITAPTADPFNIYAWANGFQGTATATATIAATDDDLSFSFDDRPPGQFFTIAVDPDFAGQNINLSFVLDSSSSGSANVALTGVAVDTAAQLNVVPEPASLALVGLGMLGLGLSRRRRTARHRQ